MDFIGEIIKHFFIFIIYIYLRAICLLFRNFIDRYIFLRLHPLVRDLIKVTFLAIMCGAVSSFLLPKLSITNPGLRWLILVVTTVLAGYVMLCTHSKSERMQAYKKSRLSVFSIGGTFALVFGLTRLILCN